MSHFLGNIYIYIYIYIYINASCLLFQKIVSIFAKIAAMRISFHSNWRETLWELNYSELKLLLVLLGSTRWSFPTCFSETIIFMDSRGNFEKLKSLKIDRMNSHFPSSYFLSLFILLIPPSSFQFHKCYQRKTQRTICESKRPFLSIRILICPKA